MAGERQRSGYRGPKKGIWRPVFLVLYTSALICMATGCVTRRQETEKIRDLEFTMIDKEMVPQEFKTVIEEKKAEPFKLTYADQGILYIAEGYGTQPTTGYSVEVKELYETAEAVYIQTSLLGPEKGEETKEIATYPYVVVQLESIEKDVLFD